MHAQFALQQLYKGIVKMENSRTQAVVSDLDDG
jgi:hypothetical protein